MLCFIVLLLCLSPNRGGGAKSKELTPAEKADQKAQKAAADKARKKRLNAPGRIVKIQARLRTEATPSDNCGESTYRLHIDSSVFVYC